MVEAIPTPEQVEAVSPRRVPSAVALPLPDVAGQALIDVGEKQAALSEGLKGKAAIAAPAIAGVRTAGEALTKTAAERPEPIVTAPPPSRKLTDFLAPVEGESPMASISKLISALGIFATGIAGSVKGDARAGLAALSGALRGWHEGDKERADRAFADWESASKTMAENWTRKRQAWQDIMESAKLTLDQKTTSLKLAMLEADMPIDSARADLEGAKYLLDLLSKKDIEFLKLDVEREKIRNAKANIWQKGLSSGVVEVLKASDPAIATGTREPNANEIGQAVERVQKREYDQRIAAAREQGLAAADIPQRTPIEMMKDMRITAMARAQITELRRLSVLPSVRLDQVMGGLRPWFNQVAETGKVSIMPVSPESFGGLNTDERRLLAVARDYVDSVLRMRSGASINEAEYERMLTFLPTETVTPTTFMTRLGSQDDLLRAKDDTTRQMLSTGGYRVPSIPLPSLAPPPETLSRRDERYAKLRARGMTDAQIMATYGVQLSD